MTKAILAEMKDDAEAAQKRALQAMRDTAIGQSPSGNVITAVHYLKLLGVADNFSDAFFDRCATSYHNEMLVHWTAVFTPIPIAKPPQVSKVRMFFEPFREPVVYSLAVIGTVVVFNAIVRALV